jgi:hypothetical protein
MTIIRHSYFGVLLRLELRFSIAFCISSVFISLLVCDLTVVFPLSSVYLTAVPLLTMLALSVLVLGLSGFCFFSVSSTCFTRRHRISTPESNNCNIIVFHFYATILPIPSFNLILNFYFDDRH